MVTPEQKLALSLVRLVVGPKIRQFLSRLPDPNTPAFKEARDELWRDWLVEINVRVQEQCEYLNARIDDLGAKIDERTGDPTCGRVYANYARAADAEPTPERRRMLEFAAAALVDARLSVPKHSRVERIIRELDPEDALWLSVLDKVTGMRKGNEILLHEDAVRWRVWNESPAADILASSACVRIRHVGGTFGGGDWDGATVTREGKLVLHVLRLYLRARTLPIEPPGREARPGDRPETEAIKILDQIPEVRSDVIRLARGPVSYDTPKSNANPEAKPPPPNAKAVLRISGVPAEDADRLSALAPLGSGPWVSVGTPVDTVLIDAKADDAGPDKRTLQLHGPHDVLRWLADDVDARWH